MIQNPSTIFNIYIYIYIQILNNKKVKIFLSIFLEKWKKNGIVIILHFFSLKILNENKRNEWYYIDYKYL